MSRIITFSRFFPSYHPRKGEPTYFVEKIYKSIYPNGFDKHFDFFLEKQNPQIKGFEFDSFFNSINTEKGILPKHHTIRAGHRWKAGDYFTPAVWGNNINPKSGRSGPYHSNQIKIAPDIEIKKVWDFKVKCIPNYEQWFINDTCVSDCSKEDWFNQGIIEEISKNDGLELIDFLDWFKHPSDFNGQIICWNENVNY